MKALILRRRKLGLGSCKGIRDNSQTGLDFVRNDQLKPDTFVGVDMVFRWGCTSTVPVNNVVNTAQAIHKIGDKGGFRNDLMMCPETTNLVPKTVFTLDEALGMIGCCNTCMWRWLVRLNLYQEVC